MARPSKPVSVVSGHRTQSEKSGRQAAEQLLRGSGDRIKPPAYLTTEQKKTFNDIVREIEATGLLGNLDVYVLTTCAVAIDRLRAIETAINEDFELLTDSKLLAAKEKYGKDLFRCCGELCMSPQARAKMGTLCHPSQKQESALKQALADDDDE